MRSAKNNNNNKTYEKLHSLFFLFAKLWSRPIGSLVQSKGTRQRFFFIHLFIFGRLPWSAALMLLALFSFSRSVDVLFVLDAD